MSASAGGGRPLTFRASKLSEQADSIWQHSKSEMTGVRPVAHFQLASTLATKKSDEAAQPSDKAAEEVGDGAAQSVPVAPAGFVFGTKIEDRVDKESSTHEAGAEPAERRQAEGGGASASSVAPSGFAALATSRPAPAAAATATNGNGSGDAAGAAVANGTGVSASGDKPHAEDEAAGSSGLHNSAREYAKKQEQPDAPDKVAEIITGEEDERNLAQTSCKLHVYQNGEWHERGRCVIRVNVTPGGEVRIVARSAGSLRVMINSKLFAKMLLERAGTKRIKLSATEPDAQAAHVFCVTATSGDADTLWSALSASLAKLSRGGESDASGSKSPLSDGTDSRGATTTGGAAGAGAKRPWHVDDDDDEQPDDTDFGDVSKKVKEAE